MSEPVCLRVCADSCFPLIVSYFRFVFAIVFALLLPALFDRDRANFLQVFSPLFQFPAIAMHSQKLII